MKGRLLTGVAAIAFGLGLATTGPALAFDNVDWSWDKDKWQTVDINTWVWSFFHPEGETEVQKTQIYVGDVTAYAGLSGDYVPQTLTVEGGTIEVPFSGTVTYDGEYGAYVDPTGQPFNGTSGTVGVSGDIDTASVAGNVLEQYESLSFTVDVSGTTTVDIEGMVQDLAQDAVDGLGHAVQDASAIGIADTIDSEFPVYAHEVQVLLGAEDLNSIEPEGDNLLEILGNVAMDLIRKSDITAVARAGAWYNPVEIAIDQDVSAVAAALSINLEANNAPALIQTVNADEGDLQVDTGDTITEYACNECSGEYGVFYPVVTNNIIEADITQFAYADVYASAKAYQDLTAFKNLGAYDRLGTPGLVANQQVSAAGLVASITNKIKVPEVTTP